MMRNLVVMLAVAGIAFVILLFYFFSTPSSSSISSSSADGESSPRGAKYGSKGALRPAPPISSPDANSGASLFFQRTPPIESFCPAGRFFSREDLQQHTTESDLWILVNGLVLNVTAFVPHHPGGVPMIMRGAGGDSDAAELFMQFHQPGTVALFKTFCIGRFKK